MRREKNKINLNSINLFSDFENQGVKFPAICKFIRNVLGATQKEMAQKLEIDVRNYQSWESGESSPNGVCAFNLCLLYLYAKEQASKQNVTEQSSQDSQNQAA